MIKMSKILSLFFLMCISFLYSCGNRITDKKIAILTNSQWICSIDDDSYAGIQALMFHKDGRFRQQDDLIFAAEDGGFEFQINVSVFNEGEWKIAGDSLFIVYSREGLRVLPDAQTFDIRPVYDNIDINGSVKEKMEEELTHYIHEDIARKYEAVADTRICFGTILEITKNTVLIKNGNMFLELRNTR